ncbi:hypothetical protein LINPERPRIM_LOCUS13847 [Linum perenne]
MAGNIKAEKDTLGRSAVILIMLYDLSCDGLFVSRSAVILIMLYDLSCDGLFVARSAVILIMLYDLSCDGHVSSAQQLLSALPAKET